MSEELARLVTRLLPAKLILELARTHGIQKRQRIFHIVPPVWVLVLVSLATPNQSFAQWHRFLLTVTSWRLKFGSGNVEATCKGVIAVRFKRSGARWKKKGAYPLVMARAWMTSDQNVWDAVLPEFLDSYVTPVAV